MKAASKIMLFLFVATLFAIPTYAQTGSISGKVLDTEGRPQAGITVVIERQGIAGRYQVNTNANGQYTHAGLPTGAYKLSATREGRTLATLENIRVTFGGNTTADFDFKILAAEASQDEARAQIEAEKAAAEAMKVAFEAGRAALAAKNFPEAIKQFEDASTKDPNQHVVFANLADAYSGARQFDKAADAYKKAVELKPDEGAYHNNLGIALGNAGKVEEASAALQKAAEVSPTTAGQAYYNLGAVLTNRGRTKEAGDAFKKAIEYSPDMAPAYYQLGISYFGNPTTIPEAIPVLEKFLTMQPTGPDADAAKQLIEAAKAAAPTGFRR
jgi:tetratricopeptide (TPR) repeat protein